MTRAKKPPDGLREILDSVNLIPVDAQMPTLYQLETGQVTLSKAVSEAVEKGGQEFWFWVFEYGWNWLPPVRFVTDEEIAARPPVDLEERRKRGWGTNLSPAIDTMVASPWNPLYRYLSVITWRETLRSIALRYENGFTATVRMEIDPENGQPKPIPAAHDPLARIIWGLDFDSRYVRQCAVESCRRLFWASRLTDKQLNDPQAELGHNSRCANTLSARRARNRKKLEDAQREIRNRTWQANYELKYKRQRSMKRNLEQPKDLLGAVSQGIRDGLSVEKIARLNEISIREVKRYIEILDRDCTT